MKTGLRLLGLCFGLAFSVVIVYIQIRIIRRERAVIVESNKTVLWGETALCILASILLFALIVDEVAKIGSGKTS